MGFFFLDWNHVISFEMGNRPVYFKISKGKKLKRNRWTKVGQENSILLVVFFANSSLSFFTKYDNLFSGESVTGMARKLGRYHYQLSLILLILLITNFPRPRSEMFLEVE